MTAEEYSALYRKSPDKAYRQLFEEYCGYVYAVVYNKLRSTASREDIEECVSDVFTDIYFNYNTESVYKGDMHGYVSTVAKRKAVDMYRRITARSAHYTETDDDSISMIHSDYDIEHDFDRVDSQRQLINAVKSLGEPDSTILIQKFYYDRTSSEIAELLSMKSASVRMRCTRALKKLGEILGKSDITL